MFSYLYNLFTKVKENLLFVPALISVVYIAALTAIMILERTVLAGTELWEIFFKGDISEAQSVIVALLSAMITMTTLAVSITIVVLSLAASQLGPRLIKSFISDHLTQVYIGIFFGTVAACFVLTAVLHDPSLASPTPRVTISAVFAACFIDLFVLLAFINHVARASIADTVIDKVSDDLLDAIERLSEPKGEKPKQIEDFPTDFDANSRTLYIQHQGYVQNIDYKHLLKIATGEGLFIKINIIAGHYLLPGENGILVYPKRKLSPDLEKEILKAFIIGAKRTPTQDVRYSMRHLVEIGIRALSPSVNDSFTAIAVINHLGAAMAHIFQKDLPKYHFSDDQGQVRVSGVSNKETDFIMYAFSPIRHAAQDKPEVLEHFIKKLGMLLGLACTSEQKEGLYRELGLIHEAIIRNFSDSTIGRELEELYNEIIAQ